MRSKLFSFGSSRRSRVFALAGLAASLLGATAPAANAELLTGLTYGNGIIVFDSGAPGSGSVKAITGLRAGEDLLGIDYRPTTGVLYGVSDLNRLYRLDPNTGAASFIATLTANPSDVSDPFTALSGQSFGLDFNPVPDLLGNPSLRVTSNAGQNLRINVNAAAAGQTFTDTNLNVPAGGNPNIVASAYINNDRDPATGTQLFGIDFATDQLMLQSNPNGGVLEAVGSLGVDTTGSVAFDVSGLTGIAYASLTSPITDLSSLYTIDLATGQATLVGAIATADGSELLLRGLAAPVPEPSTWAMLIAGVLGMAVMVRRRRALA